MDKSLARAKHAASRRGRRRFSQRRHSSAAAAAPGAATEPELWDEYQDVLPLDELGDDKNTTRGPFDYSELLARDPFYELTDTSVSGAAVAWDPLQDALEDLYYGEETNSGQATKMASLLSLDLDKLSQSLATMSLATRLCLDDENLPSELLERNEVESGERELEKMELMDEVGAEADQAQGTLEEPDAVVNSDTEDLIKAEQTSEKKTAEDDLDALLDMLNDVKIGHSEAVPDKEQEEQEQRFVSSLLDQDNVDEEEAPRQTVEVLPRQQEQVSSSSIDDDFDAWLDSLA